MILIAERIAGIDERGWGRMLGRWIRARREELGISQVELGALIERDQNYVSRLERRNEPDALLPDARTTRLLAEALRVPVDDLLIAAGYLDAADAIPVEDDPARLRDAEVDIRAIADAHMREVLLNALAFARELHEARRRVERLPRDEGHDAPGTGTHGR